MSAVKCPFTKQGCDRVDSGSITMPTRAQVLMSLWTRAKWLETKIDTRQLKPTPILRQRVWMANTHANICKAILSGLKEEEIELRVKQLEETLKGAVIIPNESKKSR